jgi:hypothetical protein
MLVAVKVPDTTNINALPNAGASPKQVLRGVSKAHLEVIDKNISPDMFPLKA